LAPAPINDGVFGMQRTTATSPPSQSSICSTRIPAAIEMINGRRASAGSRRDSQTAFITCGFTARTHIVASRTASVLADDAATPNCRASACARLLSGSPTVNDAGSAPARISPPIRLRAMLPPPMKAMRAEEPGLGRRESGIGDIPLLRMSKRVV
jgi:hypothetical protein